MRTDARPVVVFDLLANKPVWHLPRSQEDVALAIAAPRCPTPDSLDGVFIRRDHATKIGRMCDRCAKMDA